MKKILTALLLAFNVTVASALPLGSQHALVIDESSGSVLLEKNAHKIVPIASLTKLMTAMVVLDAKLNMEEEITISDDDVDTLKHSSSRVPVGTTLSRRALLELALMSSDNRAAAALGRTFPGGHRGFRQAVQRKIQELGMQHTAIEEPTGLSPRNVSTAADLAKMAQAAGGYREIEEMSTSAGDVMDINGRLVEYRNTNGLVRNKEWDIELSKTGFTSEAGRCLIMRLNEAGKKITLVLLNAKGSSARYLDAVNVRRLVTGEPWLAPAPVKVKASGRINSRAGGKKKYTNVRNDVPRAGKASIVRTNAKKATAPRAISARAPAGTKATRVASVKPGAKSKGKAGEQASPRLAARRSDGRAS